MLFARNSRILALIATARIQREQPDGLQLPLTLHPAWPVGERLRFHATASMRSRYHYLHGTPAIVLGPLTRIDDDLPWQQYVMAIVPRYPEDRFLWILPEHLKPWSAFQARRLSRVPIEDIQAMHQITLAPQRSAVLPRPATPEVTMRADLSMLRRSNCSRIPSGLAGHVRQP